MRIAVSEPNAHAAAAGKNAVRINAEQGDGNYAPELTVVVKNGLRNRRNYDIAITVYLPQGVVLEHKENFNFTQLLQKLWNKIIRKE